MLEWVKIGIPFENIHKKYQIFTGIVYFGVMKKFAYRTEDSEGGASKEDIKNISSPAHK